jgi:hypothetical protein
MCAPAIDPTLTCSPAPTPSRQAPPSLCRNDTAFHLSWLEAHAQDASSQLNKPLLLEEFGKKVEVEGVQALFDAAAAGSSNGAQTAAAAAGAAAAERAAREAVFKTVLDAVEASVKRCGGRGAFCPTLPYPARCHAAFRACSGQCTCCAGLERRGGRCWEGGVEGGTPYLSGPPDLHEGGRVPACCWCAGGVDWPARSFGGGASLCTRTRGGMQGHMVR